MPVEFRDPDSISKLCGTDKAAVVYGFDSCHYKAVGHLLKEDGIVANVYDWSFFGQPLYLNKSIKRVCKDTLTKMISRNYEKGEHEFTPIIFCIDTNENKHPLTAQTLLSKQPDLNRIITHTELRRAYKLCNDPTIDSKIRDVAKRTFKFVKVLREETKTIKKISAGFTYHSSNVRYDLIETHAPWEDPQFAIELIQRQGSKQPTTSLPKSYDWRSDLNQVVKDTLSDPKT